MMISEFPLLVFTVLTGLAAGGYVMDAIYSLIAKGRSRSWLFSLICLISLGLGMLGVLAHLGHPERFLNALANPTAMIAQEAYWSMPFGIVLLIDALLLKIKRAKGIAIPIIGSVLGIGLMVATSIAYFTSYGIAGWPELPTLFLFMVGDLALGASFAIAFSKVKAPFEKPSDGDPKKPSGAESGRIASERSDCIEPNDKDRKAIVCIAVILYLMLVIVFISEAIVFADLAVGPWGFLVAAVIDAAAASLQIVSSMRKVRIANLEWVCFTLVALSVIISRWAFYAMA